MTFVRSLVLAFACFSRVPMPRVAWNDRNMRYLLAGLPLVGALVGACVWGWVAFARTMGFGPILVACGITLAPLVVTGGIHLDGFADVVDAQASHAEPERKREILKDPHVGAFATLGITCYLLASFALATEVEARMVPFLALMPVLSRCLVGLATLTWDDAGTSGMLATLKGAANVRAVCVLLMTCAVMTSAGMLALSVGVGVALVVVAGAVFAWTHRFVRIQFQGMSGDLSGFLLQLLEVAMLCALVLAERMV